MLYKLYWINIKTYIVEFLHHLVTLSTVDAAKVVNQFPGLEIEQPQSSVSVRHYRPLAWNLRTNTFKSMPPCCSFKHVTFSKNVLKPSFASLPRDLIPCHTKFWNMWFKTWPRVLETRVFSYHQAEFWLFLLSPRGRGKFCSRRSGSSTSKAPSRRSSRKEYSPWDAKTSTGKKETTC